MDLYCNFLCNEINLKLIHKIMVQGEISCFNYIYISAPEMENCTPTYIFLMVNLGMCICAVWTATNHHHCHAHRTQWEWWNTEMDDVCVCVFHVWCPWVLTLQELQSLCLFFSSRACDEGWNKGEENKWCWQVIVTRVWFQLTHSRKSPLHLFLKFFL